MENCLEDIRNRALIWYWDHLKNFIAEILQGPLAQCRLSPSVVLLGKNQCRLQAVRVDALFVVMLLSSLDSVEHVNFLS